MIIRKATVDETEADNIRLYRRLGFEKKRKDCTSDPCARNKKMEPKECPVFWLLYQDLC